MPPGDGFRFGAFRLDLRARRLFFHDAPVALKPLQFNILHALASRPGELVTKDDLMKADRCSVCSGRPRSGRPCSRFCSTARGDQAKDE